MNYLTHLPPELLFHVITGHSDPSNRAALKVFLCSKIQQTSHVLNLKVNECWEAAFLGFLENWKTCKDFSKEHFLKMQHPKRFILNWIDGKVTIKSVQHKYLLPKDFSSDLIHIITRTTANRTYTLACSQTPLVTEFSFFDFKAQKLLGELKYESCLSLDPKGTELLTLETKGVFFRIHNVINHTDEMLYLPFNSQAVCSSTLLPFSAKSIKSMHLLEDHLIFILYDKIVTISTDDLIKSNTEGFLHYDQKVLRYLKAFNSELLVCTSNSTFQILYLEEGVLKSRDCLIDGTLPKGFYLGCSHAFHAQSQSTIFRMFEDHQTARLATFAVNELTPSDPQILYLDEQQIPLRSTLVEFKDTVLLCGINENNQLYVQNLHVMDGKITRVPYEIKGMPDISFTAFYAANVYLDKLFVYAKVCTDPYFGLHDHFSFLIIDLATCTFENDYTPNCLQLPQTLFATNTPETLYFRYNQSQSENGIQVDYHFTPKKSPKI